MLLAGAILYNHLSNDLFLPAAQLSVKALFFGLSVRHVCPSICIVGSAWLPRYLVNSFSRLDETYRECSLARLRLVAPTD